jgi:hypothetical protein
MHDKKGTYVWIFGLGLGMIEVGFYGDIIEQCVFFHIFHVA